MAPARGPRAPEQPAAERMGEAPAPHAALDEETAQVGRLLAHVEARVDGSAGELEALEQRRLELRCRPVGEETLGELEAPFLRAVELRSRLLRLHVSASLGKAAIGSRIDELRAAPGSARPAERGTA